VRVTQDEFGGRIRAAAASRIQTPSRVAGIQKCLTSLGSRLRGNDIQDIAQNPRAGDRGRQRPLRYTRPATEIEAPVTAPA
jgi:hypothetical protein